MLSDRLQTRRERLALTQENVSQVLGVTRELVSLWETEQRIPSLRQLEHLATLYGVSTDYLLGKVDLPEEHERQVLFRGLPENEHVRFAVNKWLGFLDQWAEFLEEDLELELPGPSRPPKKLDQGQVITDSRRAPTLADQVRDFYNLGRDALPDLYAFLDEQDVLVYRAALGRIDGDLESISGAFYNHPKLGYCILVNTDTALGRQAFTLAHEWAHALYHYSRGGIICRREKKDPLERFADAFAANFLVSGKELRRLAGDNLDHFDALKFAQYFGVSYAMMLVRLRQERLIAEAQYAEWKGYSPRAMANFIGLNPADFALPDTRIPQLDRYPISVLEKIEGAIQEELLSPAQAADLLDVDVTLIQRALLSPPPEAEDFELYEYAELPF